MPKTSTRGSACFETKSAVPIDYGIEGTVGLGEKLRNFQVHPLNTTKSVTGRCGRCGSGCRRRSASARPVPERPRLTRTVSRSTDRSRRHPNWKKSEHKVRSAAKITKFTFSKLDYSTKNPLTPILLEPRSSLQHYDFSYGLKITCNVHPITGDRDLGISSIWILFSVPGKRKDEKQIQLVVPIKSADLDTSTSWKTYARTVRWTALILRKCEAK